MEKIGHHTVHDEFRFMPEEQHFLLSKLLENLKANQERKTHLMFISTDFLFTAMKSSVLHSGCSGLWKSLTANSLNAAPTCRVF